MKSILIITFVFLSQSICAQKNKTVSFDVSSNYYIPLIDAKPLFSYGFSFHVVNRINKFSLSFGLNYNRIRFEELFAEEYNYLHLTEKKYEIEYLDFPILFLFPNKEIKTVNIKAIAGLVFNTELDYTETSYYDNSEPKITKGRKSPSKLGMSFKGGLEISRFISTNWYIGLTPYIDVMFISIYDTPHPKSGDRQTEKGIVFGTNLTIGFLAF
tara:strand:- start:231886 stop:232524 length:639 start_codon:yes stop_codon:yes gene_type:complete